MTKDTGSDGEAGAGSRIVDALSLGAGGAAGYRLGGTGGAGVGAFAGRYLKDLLQGAADELFTDRAGRAEEMLQSAGRRVCTRSAEPWRRGSFRRKTR
jgi:hypothetical protein